MKTPEEASHLASYSTYDNYQAFNSGVKWNRVPHATLSLQHRHPCNAHIPHTSEGILGFRPNPLLLVHPRTCASTISHSSGRTRVCISRQSSVCGIANMHTCRGRSQSVICIISAVAEYWDPLTFLESNGIGLSQWIGMCASYEFDALAQIWNMDTCRFARSLDGREI
jgi:hypothetical protein